MCFLDKQGKRSTTELLKCIFVGGTATGDMRKVGVGLQDFFQKDEMESSTALYSEVINNRWKVVPEKNIGLVLGRSKYGVGVFTPTFLSVEIESEYLKGDEVHLRGMWRVLETEEFKSRRSLNINFEAAIS